MIDLILPRRCACCERVLLPAEDSICLSCLARLPRVRAERPRNEVEYRLLGRFAFEHATAFCYYLRDDALSGVIRQAKFAGRPWLNARLTRLFVQELRIAAAEDATAADPSAAADPATAASAAPSATPSAASTAPQQSAWPYDIDVIVPIPVHWFRLVCRGYNQTMPICEELSRAWQLPIETGCLRKARYTSSQVGLRGEVRLRQEAGSFGVRHPERLASRHVLLVDDVITTGATVQAAADALLRAVPGVRISVLALSFAKS